MTAEPLSHVLSLAEEKEQKEKKPDQGRQVGIHLDSTLTIQTRRRYVSSPPSNTEELRTKYKIMTNLWLLAQMREPGRKLYADLRQGHLHGFRGRVDQREELPAREEDQRSQDGYSAMGTLRELRARIAERSNPSDDGRKLFDQSGALDSLQERASP